MTLHKLIPATLILISLCKCKDIKVDNFNTNTDSLARKLYIDSIINKLDGNIKFIADSLLITNTFSLKNNIEKYQSDSCGIITYENSSLKQEFEGIKKIGNMHKTGLVDSVFVLPPFNNCDDGYSYYFTDTSLPRLYTDSYCCHPENLFDIGDIDEDGVSEICIFHSSCVSRFKALIAYSLKGNKWQQVGQCGFDISLMKPAKEQRVRKTAKGKFEMLEIIDKEENKVWRQFSF